MDDVEAEECDVSDSAVNTYVLRVALQRSTCHCEYSTPVAELQQRI